MWGMLGDAEQDKCVANGHNSLVASFYVSLAFFHLFCLPFSLKDIDGWLIEKLAIVLIIEVYLFGTMSILHN